MIWYFSTNVQSNPYYMTFKVAQGNLPTCPRQSMYWKFISLEEKFFDKIFCIQTKLDEEFKINNMKIFNIFNFGLFYSNNNVHNKRKQLVYFYWNNYNI